MNNITDIKNINMTIIDIYIEPANDWISDLDSFDVRLLNLTW